MLPKAERGQIGLLIDAGERRVDLRQQKAALDGGLALPPARRLCWKPTEPRFDLMPRGNRVVERNRERRAGRFCEVGTLPW